MSEQSTVTLPGGLPGELPPETELLDAPITAVTVSEDRAEVRRGAELRWSKGRHSLFVGEITIYASDSSLRATIEGVSAPVIGSARVLRWYVEPTGDFRAKERAFVEKLDALLARCAGMQLRGRREWFQLEALARAISATRESVMRDVVHREARPGSYREKVAALYCRLGELQESQGGLRSGLRDLLEEVRILLEDPEERPDGIRKRAGVLLSYEAAAEGRGRIELTYESPCAQWRPMHEAHLERAGSNATILLVTHGVVWQKTGEDWNGVECTLSTARPSLGLEMPPPREDYLELREKTQEERKTVRVRMRDQHVADTGAEEDRGPGVPDDGGQTQKYVAAGRITIPGDGLPCLVELARLEAPCSASLVASPELCDRVFLQSRQKAGPRPVLAGPVELYRQGGYVGRGFMEFVGPGEPFDISWGSEDFVQLVRWVDASTEEAAVLSKEKRHVSVNVVARNLDRQEVSFTLTERLPVSEIAQVQVEVDKLPEGASADRDGFVKLEVKVPGRSEKKLEITYHLTLDKNVVM